MGEPDNVRRLGRRSQVLTGIQEWILEARLRAGDRLPPAGELARALGVGEASIREGVRVLESLGVLAPGPGGDVVVARPATGLDTLLGLHVSLSAFGVADLMSIRVDLERSSAARAATEALSDDLAQLRSLIEEMSSPSVDRAGFRELDCEFHLVLARAAHNELAATLLASLSDAVKGEMAAGYARTGDWRRTARRLAAEHCRILAAVEDGDPVQAAEATTAHIARFYGLRAS